jgi:hypothetical protein
MVEWGQEGFERDHVALPATRRYGPGHRVAKRRTLPVLLGRCLGTQGSPGKGRLRSFMNGVVHKRPAPGAAAGDVLPLFLLTLGALLIRLFRLDGQSLWIDECVTVSRGSVGPRQDIPVFVLHTPASPCLSALLAYARPLRFLGEAPFGRGRRLVCPAYLSRRTVPS